MNEKINYGEIDVEGWRGILRTKFSYFLTRLRFTSRKSLYKSEQKERMKLSEKKPFRVSNVQHKKILFLMEYKKKLWERKKKNFSRDNRLRPSTTNDNEVE